MCASPFSSFFRLFKQKKSFMNFLTISRLCHLIFQKTEGVSYRETLYLIVIYCEIEKLRVIKQTENFYFEYGFHWCSKNVLWPACVIGVPRVKRKRQTHSGVYKAPSSYYIYIHIHAYTCTRIRIWMSLNTREVFHRILLTAIRKFQVFMQHRIISETLTDG